MVTKVLRIDANNNQSEISIDIPTAIPAATNTLYVSPSFTGLANPYFSDLEAALLSMTQNLTNKTIFVYQGSYTLSSATSSISGVNDSSRIYLKCFGNVNITLSDMYHISKATIDGAYFNLAGQVTINTSTILNCDFNSGIISCNADTVRFDCPKTSPWNLYTNCKVTGTIENLASLNVYGGTALLNIADNAGLVTIQASGTAKIKANSATNIVNYGSFSGEIATLALGSSSITNFGTLKLKHSVITNNSSYAIYGGSSSKSILKSSTVNSISNGYGINSYGEVLLRNCVFTGKSATGVSVITTGTLNAFEVDANGSVTGTISSQNALRANIIDNLIVDVL